VGIWRPLLRPHSSIACGGGQHAVGKKSHQKFKTDPQKIAPEIQNRPTKNRTRNSKPTHEKSHQKFKTDPQKIAPEIQNRPTKNRTRNSKPTHKKVPEINFRAMKKKLGKMIKN